MQSNPSTAAAPRVNVPFVVAVGALCAAAFAFNYQRYGFQADSYLWTIRTVVKVAFCFFFMSYVASPLHQWKPSGASAFLVRHRATTGAAFAVAQLSAACCALTIWSNWPQIIHAISQPAERVAGLVVFAWIFLMLATSNQWAVGKMGRRGWSSVHGAGMAVIWIAYLLDYGRRMVEWSPLYGIFVAALLFVLVLRLRLIVLRRMAVPGAPA